jgi:hypothetical protein
MPPESNSRPGSVPGSQVKPAFLDAVWGADEYDAKPYWAPNTGLRMADAYGPVVEDPVACSPWRLWVITPLLGDLGNLEEALALRSHLVQRYREEGDLVYRQASLGSEALILRIRRRS